MILRNPSNRKQLEVQATPEVMKVFGDDCAKKEFICLPYREPKVKFDISMTKRINGTCVVRMGGLGDLIMLSSGLKELKKRMGNEKLTFATLPENISFMKGMKFIDEVISVDDVTRLRFDKVIDLRFAVEPPELGNNCKGTWDSYTMDDRSDAFDKLLGIYPAPKRFEVPFNSHKIPTGHILIVASMCGKARSIPVNYIKPLCSLITGKLSKRVVLIGESKPWNMELRNLSLNRVSNFIDKTDVFQMIALCQSADLIISPDTGPLHVAGALGKRAIGIFGPIHPRTRISYYPSVKVIYPHGELPCIPCWDLHPCLNKMENPKCMEISTPETIFKAVTEIYS